MELGCITCVNSWRIVSILPLRWARSLSRASIASMRFSASSSGGLRGNVFADDDVISDGVGLRLVALTKVRDDIVSVLSA